MKKMILFVAVIAPLFWACGGGKYAEPQAVMTDMVQVYEGFITGMEKAGSADDVVKAIEGFSDGMQKFMPKMKELSQKYPELMNTKAAPAELKPLMDKMEELSKRMMGSMGKIMQYATDPKVIAAQQKMTAAMMAAK